jgi:hypothetical protein
MGGSNAYFSASLLLVGLVSENREKAEKANPINYIEKHRLFYIVR